MRYLLLIMLLSLTLVSCQTAKETGTVTEPFTGTWRVIFNGELEGTGILYIKEDNSFTSDNFRLRNINNNTYTNFSAQGKIVITSIQNGSLLRSNVQVGDFNGSFFKFTGTGTFNTGLDGLSGTWEASKN